MPISSTTEWDDFMIRQNASFLQSLSWAKFQEKIHGKIMFLKGEFWQCLAVVHRLPLNKSYFYIPRGPVWDSQKTTPEKVLPELISLLKKESKEFRSIFTKIEPDSNDPKLADLMAKIGFNASKPVQPQDTLIIDLQKPEQEIFQNFEKRCRYEISKAEKNGTIISSDLSEPAIHDFLHLLDNTALRDSFHPHSHDYLHDLITVLGESNACDLFRAQTDGAINAGAIVAYFGPTASYIHAASAGRYRATNAVVWEAIKAAKKRGCSKFDLYGIAPKTASSSHPWSGLTMFKQSFGGEKKHYIGTFDYPLSKTWHGIYKMAKIFSK